MEACDSGDANSGDAKREFLAQFEKNDFFSSGNSRMRHNNGLVCKSLSDRGVKADGTPFAHMFGADFVESCRNEV